MSVWIVVPTLNEAGNIRILLEQIHQEMLGLRYQVCIVDDGSTDGTLDAVRDFAVETEATNIVVLRRKKKHGGSQRGVAVWTGLKHGYHHSDSDVFVEMDADLSHRPEELRQGLDAILLKSANVAIVSKYLPESKVTNRSFGRRLLSLVANGCVRVLITRRVTDYSNGYRFYDRECAGMICTHRLRYGSPIYLTEVLALLMAHRMRVHEFPGEYVGRGEGLSKLRPIDLLKAGIAVFDIALRFHAHRRGFVRGTPAFSVVIGDPESESHANPKQL